MSESELPYEEEKNLDDVFADDEDDEGDDTETQSATITEQLGDLSFETQSPPESTSTDKSLSIEELPPGLLLRSSRILALGQRLRLHNICYRCQKFSSVNQLLYCSTCSKTYHERCYPLELCHQNVQFINKCDPPTTLRVHIWVSALLDSTTSSRRQLELHVEDVYTKWFGVPHSLASDGQASPELLVWPRMHYIFQDIQGSNQTPFQKPPDPCPSICSFFGDTGAGKSTIIRALIRMQSPSEKDDAPISGNDADTLKSTSGDVHLYADPASVRNEHPIVYADCEGLRGDRRPVAADLKKRVVDSGQGPNRPVSALSAGTLRHPQFSSRYQDGRSNSINPLTAISSSINPFHAKSLDDDKLLRTLHDHEKTSSKSWKLQWKEIKDSTSQWRAEVVKNLYPRFLYMFSDVVCYVSRNTKTTKDDLANLVNWALVGYDQTTNQGVRPALIIIINNDDRNNAAQWCNTDYATNAVLDDLVESTWFEEQKVKWESRGRSVKNSKDLLKLYYDGLRVVTIPSPKALSTSVILQQYQKLYKEIRISSERVQKRRRTSGMKVDVESLTIYTEIAFEQLSRKLHGTIDLYDIVSRVKSLPRSFSEHLTNVLAKLNRENEGGEESQLLARILPYLATSLALELAAEPRDQQEDIATEYLSQCNKAFQDFHAHHWRCEALLDESESRQLAELSPFSSSSLWATQNLGPRPRSPASSSFLGTPAGRGDSDQPHRRRAGVGEVSANAATTRAKRFSDRPELNPLAANLTDLPQRSASARNATPSKSEPSNIPRMHVRSDTVRDHGTESVGSSRQARLKTMLSAKESGLQQAPLASRQRDTTPRLSERLGNVENLPAGNTVNDVERRLRLTTSLETPPRPFTTPSTRNPHLLKSGTPRRTTEMNETGVSAVPKRCINYRDSHEKGHQYPGEFPLRTPTIRLGGFSSDFAADELSSKLIDSLDALLNSSELLRNFQESVKSTGLAKLHTNTTCLICFRRMPIHNLKCKHTFCGICIRRLSITEDPLQSHIATLAGCPLHPADNSEQMVFRFRPTNAGIRTLALDGGGVRGVLELCILQELVREVGYGIPIQELFDLAIGTSTGGIIALGLFKQEWSPTKCLREFKSLVNQAFEKRFWLGVPIFRHAAQLLYSHRYESFSISSALRTAFGPSIPENRLFATRRYDGAHVPKVGVVAMSGENQAKAYLLANYSRDWEPQQGATGISEGLNLEDYLRREEDPADELHTWEAARCTSAAPTYFREFRHSATSRTYTDGGTRFNNPVAMTDWERRLVWPDADHLPPDIILSIGAGIGPKPQKEGSASQVLRFVLPRGLKERVGVMHQMFKATLDCERIYQEYSNQFVGNSVLGDRCHRLNIVLPGKPCKLDDVDKIFELENTALEFLAPSSRKVYDGRYRNAAGHIRAIAYKLRASLFYFDVAHDQQVTDAGHSKWKIAGRLRCRLSHHMQEPFQNLLDGGDRGRCQFRVRSKYGMGIWPISAPQWNTKNFTTDVSFSLEDRHTTVYIEMRFEAEERWEIISGFPRILEVNTFQARTFSA